MIFYSGGPLHKDDHMLWSVISKTLDKLTTVRALLDLKGLL